MTSRLLIADATIDKVRRETVAQQVHCQSIETIRTRQSGENQQRCRKLSCIPSSAYQSSTSELICFSGTSAANNLRQSVRRQQNHQRLVCRTFIHFCTYMFFSVTKMPLFGLQACVGNYQKITNTNATANNPPIYKTKAATIFVMQ